MKKYIDIELPFSGFYESGPSHQIDNALEMALSDDQGELKPGAADNMWDAEIDYKAIEREFCIEYASELASELGIEILFEELTSPKFYNFSTDRIFCKAPAKDINRIRREVEQYPEWPQYIKDRFTSYSGFSSNYSNDSKDNDWTRPDLDECQYSIIIKCYLDHQGIEYQAIEYEVNVYEFNTIWDAVEQIEKHLKQLKEV